MRFTCSSIDCDATAIETLYLRGQVGHVHDCASHAALLREWCDVTKSLPMHNGICYDAVCTKRPVHVAVPQHLDDPEDA